jgi:hypothetical protein
MYSFTRKGKSGVCQGAETEKCLKPEKVSERDEGENNICPLSGERNPQIICNKVDFPDPFFPVMAVGIRDENDAEKFRKSVVFPNDLFI